MSLFLGVLVTKPPCPAFGGVAPPNMKIEQVAGGTSNSIFELKNKILPKWIENVLEQALNPDRMRTLGPIGDGPFWFRLVRVGISKRVCLGIEGGNSELF
jgi:hypothetical protein